jgi:hypothetical protein
MATSRGKGTPGTAEGGTGDTAAPRARRTRTRAPGDEIGGTAAPEAAVPPAAPAPKKPRGGKKRETYVETAARRRKEKEVDQLQADLRAFAIARPAGWNHEDWMSFLGHLGEKGHDVSDHQAVGIRLERERLAVALEAIEGLGPKRVQSLVNRFQTMWSMRHAQAADVATVAGMTRPLAERVVQQMAERYP